MGGVGAFSSGLGGECLVFSRDAQRILETQSRPLPPLNNTITIQKKITCTVTASKPDCSFSHYAIKNGKALPKWQREEL